MKRINMDNRLTQRLTLLGIGVLAVHLFLIGRLYYLQVIRHADSNDKPLLMHEGFRKLEARRGLITDRHYRPLAMQDNHITLTANPQLIDDPEKTVQILGDILEWDRAERQRQIERIRTSKQKSFFLQRDIPHTAVEKIAAVSASLLGIGTETEPARFYPEGRLASSVLGFVGLDMKGMAGLEMKYDVRLQGESQTVRVRKDRKGYILSDRDWTRSTTIHGQNLVLTIDAYLQFRAEKALERVVVESEASEGMIVAMEPKSGEILAMCQYPSADPNNYQKAKPRDQKPRTVTDALEPGSVIKPFIVASAIERNIVKPDHVFYCENGFYYPSGRRTPIRDDIHEFGNLTVHDILVCSSNIGTVKIAQLLGNGNSYSADQGTYNALYSFGFGQKTGIDLPGEVPGLFPRPGTAYWSGASITTIPFGQGISATAIQITRAYAVLANNGFLVTPHLVRGYRSNIDGSFIPKKDWPEPKRVLSEATVKTIGDILVDVTENHTDSDDPEARGTGRDVKIPGYRICGKTGTAQVASKTGPGYVKGLRNASFAGYFPKDNPRVVMYVLLCEPKKGKYGGQVAGPIFKELAEVLIPYWGLLPSHPEELQQPTPVEPMVQAEEPPVPEVDEKVVLTQARDAILDGRVPELRGVSLRNCLFLLADTGTTAELLGNYGRITKQSIAPGETIEKKSLGTLTFATELSSPKEEGSGAIASRE